MADSPLQNFLKEVDDWLVHDIDEKDAIQYLRTFFLRCQDHGITLTKIKIEARTYKKYGGLELNSETGCKPLRLKYQTLSETEHPTNLSQLRSYMGLINYLSQITPDLREQTPKLRKLLCKGVKYIWSPRCQAEFQSIKETMTRDSFLKSFDISCIRSMCSDFIHQGIRFYLVQYDFHNSNSQLNFNCIGSGD